MGGSPVSVQNDRENDRECLDEWTRDVIRWTRERLEDGRFVDVDSKIEEVVTALINATRPEFRIDVLELIRTILKVINVAMRRGDRCA